MNDLASGFVTGLANSLAGGIEERSKVARDYFQKQYEIATTVGLENHRKVKTAVDGSVKLAKQLQQMGVPKNIIMAVASQDPTSLESFYEDVTSAQAEGVTLDQAFFDDFVTVSEDFKAPDEDFYTFFKKALTPVQATIRANPEGFKKDRKGGFFSAFMAADPYQRAQEKLDETVVIDGLSASDLAKYGKDYTPAGVESPPTVTYDYSSTAKEKTSDLSVSEIGSIEKTIDEATNRIWTAPTNVAKKMTVEEARILAVEEARKKFQDVPGVDEYLRKTYGGDATTTPTITTEELSGAGIGVEEAPVEDPTKVSTEVTTPLATPATETTTPAAEGPPVGSTVESNEPVQPEQENLGTLVIKGLVLQFYQNNSDGTVSYTDQEGNTYDFAPSEVRAFVKEFGTNYRE